MSTVALTVNGETVTANVTPRTHLADFLREQRLLTGTHLGCEHGVCGACTLLIDGAPARSCIAFLAMLNGAAITTIEGLRHDPVMERLRTAFTAEHALQCGYCTPGMLVTARDIVLRLPDADEARVRLELAGNLCRCTGYAGIVRAILRVLAEPPVGAQHEPIVLPRAKFDAQEPPPPMPAARAPPAPSGTALAQHLRIAKPLDAVWQAVQDPALIASCIPGATVTRIDGNVVEGEMLAALGPLSARFHGTAHLDYAADHSGRVSGEGRDRASGTRLSGAAAFRLRADGAGTVIELAIDYALRGPLAQFGRAAVVRAFAAEIGDMVAANLDQRLSAGGTQAAPEPARPTRLSLGRLLWRTLRRWLGSIRNRVARFLPR